MSDGPDHQLGCVCTIDGPYPVVVADGGTGFTWAACERPEQPPDPETYYHLGCQPCAIAAAAHVANTRCPARRARRAAVAQLVADPLADDAPQLGYPDRDVSIAIEPRFVQHIDDGPYFTAAWEHHA